MCQQAIYRQLTREGIIAELEHASDKYFHMDLPTFIRRLDSGTLPADKESVIWDMEARLGFLDQDDTVLVNARQSELACN